MYRQVEQLTQLCDFTYVAYDSVFPNCLRSERYVSRICVPYLVGVTGRTIFTTSSDVLGTKTRIGKVVCLTKAIDDVVVCFRR
jgi:hypothetical protein